MAEVWPASVPSSLIEPRITLPDGRIKSQTDTGPGKVRRRSSAMASQLTGRLVMTYDQWTILQTFILSTTAGGTLPFTFPSQMGGSSLLCRFGDTLPALTRYGFGEVVVELDLEVLP